MGHSRFRIIIYDSSSPIQFNKWIKHFGQFSEGCLYIAVEAEDEEMNGFSGKYYFHSLHKNVGVYIREPGTELFESMCLMGVLRSTFTYLAPSLHWEFSISILKLNEKGMPNMSMFIWRLTLVLTLEHDKTSPNSLIYFGLGPVPQNSSGQIFLVHANGTWYITDDEENDCFLWHAHNKSWFFKLRSKG